MRASGRFLLFAPPQPPCTLVPGESVVIGRGASCDLTLPSPAASRRHAEGGPRGHGWARRDRDSTDEVRRAKAAEALQKRKIDEELQSWFRQIRDVAYIEYRLDE